MMSQYHKWMLFILKNWNNNKMYTRHSQSEHQAIDHEYFRKHLSPANPIITKKIELNEHTRFSLQNALIHQNQKLQKIKQQIKEDQQLSQDNEEMDRLTLFNGYSNKALIFKKFDNSQFWERNRKKYYASVFSDFGEWPQKKVHSVEVSGLRFSSDQESMNLFAVYQTGPFQFDLILQNDINTCGYTQWYYFSVFNKHKNQTVKFNIVNLYKSRSLYNSGMKPLILSKKTGKGWQRTGTSVFYNQNEINVEHSRKLYKTLTFEHTFTVQNNETHFAHCYPYPYSQLKQRIKSLQKNPRVKLRYIGTTSLKKQIPMLQYSQQDSNTNKKAIIIMGRQHPGETVGSLIMDQIMAQLTKAGIENQFLLWRFNIYLIPMVNVDGVLLGNYRGNSWGYDLNRCWDRDNPNKLPQIVCIKKQIKKIQKKFPIQLMLDLHGHSRKMGSFFYGNPFGKYTGLYAYVASNSSPSISFEDSTFHKQRSEKVTTARIVLGNIIKDTGSFYTYETSFYGSIVNNKKVHFSLESFQELGKILISSIYKTFVEINKEEKTLKQSLFLKQVRKQINISHKLDKDGSESSSGSDSEAEKLTEKQFKIKNEEQRQLQFKRYEKKDYPNQSKLTRLDRTQVQVQAGEGTLQQSDLVAEVPSDYMVESEISMSNIKKQLIKNQRRLQQLGAVSQKFSLYVGFQKSEQLMDTPGKNPKLADNLNRKNFLLQKLRVFGQTFIQPNPKQTSKQTQTGNFPLNIQGLSKKSISVQQQESPTRSPQFRKRKNRNKSLIIRLQNKDKLAMADIVKVNKLQYKRIQRDSLLESHRRELQKDHNKINILPNIN